MEIRISTEEAEIMIAEYLTSKGFEFLGEDQKQVNFKEDELLGDWCVFQAFVAMP